MEMGFLDTLAMVALRIRQAKQTLFEEITWSRSVPIFHYQPRLHLLLSVPERERDVLQVVGVRDTGDTILAPAIGARPRMIMRKV
jgi:hypothetical protein